MKKTSRIRNQDKKHITIDTPCSVSDMESFLHIVANEGHWHNAIVKGENGKIIVEFETDDSLQNSEF